MSINYYLRRKDAVTGETSDDHVGLLAGGMFRFRAHPDQRITSFQDWLKRLNEPGSVLVDEYDDEIILERFLNCVMRKREEAMSNHRMREYHNASSLDAGETHKPGSRYRDAEGFFFNDFEFS